MRVFSVNKKIKHYLFLKVFHQVLFSFSRPFSRFYICLLPNMEKKIQIGMQSILNIKKQVEKHWTIFKKTKNFLLPTSFDALPHQNCQWSLPWIEKLYTVKRANSAGYAETSELQTPTTTTQISVVTIQ